MTRDEIIAMATEAGLNSYRIAPGEALAVWERFAALVAEAERAARIAAQTEAVELKERIARSGVEERRAVAAEREACAKVADATFRGKPGQSVNLAVANAIRQRGAA